MLGDHWPSISQVLSDDWNGRCDCSDGKVVRSGPPHADGPNSPAATSILFGGGVHDPQEPSVIDACTGRSFPTGPYDFDAFHELARGRLADDMRKMTKPTTFAARQPRF
jgi:hypothetical protein